MPLLNTQKLLEKSLEDFEKKFYPPEKATDKTIGWFISKKEVEEQKAHLLSAQKKLIEAICEDLEGKKRTLNNKI
jgi:hypothetical protein